MSGLEMMEAYRKWAAEPDQADAKRPLIWGMSATALHEEQMEGIRLGMHLFSVKPLNHDNILAMLQLLPTHTSDHGRLVEELLRVSTSPTSILTKRLDTVRDEATHTEKDKAALN